MCCTEGAFLAAVTNYRPVLCRVSQNKKCEVALALLVIGVMSPNGKSNLDSKWESPAEHFGSEAEVRSKRPPPPCPGAGWRNEDDGMQNVTSSGKCKGKWRGNVREHERANAVDIARKIKRNGI